MYTYYHTSDCTYGYEKVNAYLCYRCVRAGYDTRAASPPPRPYSLVTVKFSTAQHSTAQHSTARHGTARHGTARHGTARHGTVWYGMVWYGMVWYGMVWYGILYYTILYYTVLYYTCAWPGYIASYGLWIMLIGVLVLLATGVETLSLPVGDSIRHVGVQSRHRGHLRQISHSQRRIIVPT